MGAFGGELWNVLEVDPGLPMPMSDVRMRLGEILASAGRSPLPGVIVYLPPRDYRIDAQAPIRRVLGDAWDDPDLLIPPKVLLWFAPNARLIIGPNAVVRFDGSLRADPRQIFLCNGSDSPTSRRGRVLLYSTKVAEVYPEWWGAVSSPDDTIYMAPPRVLDDTNALEDCIRTAHTLRVFPNGPMPTIPIVLRGKYTLRREIEISARGPRLIQDGVDNLDRAFAFAENTAGIVLLGRRPISGANAGFPALVAGGDFSPPADPRVPRPTDVPTDVTTMPSGRALLRLVGLHGSIIEGVGFDGATPATLRAVQRE